MSLFGYRKAGCSGRRVGSASSNLGNLTKWGCNDRTHLGFTHTLNICCVTTPLTETIAEAPTIV